MRISTIHAFCQSLLHAFPLEAGLPPQFSVLEDMDAASLLADAREAVLAGNGAPGRQIALLAGLVGAEDFSKTVGALMRDRYKLAECLRASNGLPGLRLRLAQLPGLEDGEDPASVIAALCDVPDAVARAAAALLNHKNKTPRDLATKMRDWLAQDAEARALSWEIWPGLVPHRQGHAAHGAGRRCGRWRRRLDRILAGQQKLAACRLLEATEALLALAGPVLDHDEARKRNAGLLAYDDLIAIAQRVLKDPGSAWVLFKPDGGLRPRAAGRGAGHQPGAMGHRRRADGRVLRQRGALGSAPSSRLATSSRRSTASRAPMRCGFGIWEGTTQRRVLDQGGSFRKVELNVSFRSTAPVLALVDAVFADGAARAGVVADGAVLQHRRTAPAMPGRSSCGRCCARRTSRSRRPGRCPTPPRRSPTPRPCWPRRWPPASPG